MDKNSLLLQKDLFRTPLICSNEQNVQLFHPHVKTPCRLFLLGDYHCTLDDERGKPFQKYSARMAQYGNKDMDLLEEQIRKAQEAGAHGILLLGDMISFPTEAGVERLGSIMKESSVPIFFTAGNHDWHYEGTSGSDMEQRSEWIRKRLISLYQGLDPLNYAVEINGIRILMIDNSVYEILPEQLSFLEQELSDGKNTIVACHIPFHLPGLDRGVTSYGCGHPLWGADSDPYFEIEQRERWSEKGLSQTCFEFCRKVLTAENVLGIVAGHTHRYMLDTFHNRFQLVVSSKSGCMLDLGPMQR